MAKHIFVTGGVVSSLGKGLTCASIGMLLEAPRPARPAAEVRSVHQRRSGHDEPLSARRSLRPRRRQRDRPRPRPLRAVHQRPADPRLQLHHRPDLPVGHREGAAGEFLGKTVQVIPHVTDEIKACIRKLADRRRRRGHHRDRRHGRRHREPAVPRSDPPVRARRRQGELPLHPPDAGAVPQGGRRAEDQADAALGRPAAADRHPARHPHLPHRAVDLRAKTARRSPCSATSPTRR